MKKMFLIWNYHSELDFQKFYKTKNNNNATNFVETQILN